MIVRNASETAVLEFPGGKVAWTATQADALEFITSTESFRVRDLPCVLADVDRVALVRELIRSGALQFQKAASRSTTKP